MKFAYVNMALEWTSCKKPGRAQWSDDATAAESERSRHAEQLRDLASLRDTGDSEQKPRCLGRTVRICSGEFEHTAGPPRACARARVCVCACACVAGLGQAVTGSLPGASSFFLLVLFLSPSALSLFFALSLSLFLLLAGGCSRESE